MARQDSGRTKGHRSPGRTGGGYSNDSLGRIAQQRVGLWVEEAHLNHSVAGPDLDGWDLHISEPRDAPADGGTFFDSDPPRLSCFVQVKGSRIGSRRRGIALKHWHHAATIPSPWFFVIVEFDMPPEPARLFVVPMDDTLIEKTARRLREEGAKHAGRGTPPAIHRLEMELAWNDSHQVVCNGQGLANGIRTHVGNDLAAYVARKRNWWTSAGEATARTEVTLHIRGPKRSTDEQMAAWALGLVDTIQVDEIERTEHRWGIRKPLQPAADGTLRFAKPPTIGTTELRIADRDGSEQATLKADVFCNVRYLPQLPREHWALRFVSEFLEIVVRADARLTQVTIRDPLETQSAELSKLATFARAARLLTSESTLAYRIPGEAFDETRHEFKNTNVSLANISLLRSFEDAWRLANLFNLDPNVRASPAVLGDFAAQLREYVELQSADNITAQILTSDQVGCIDGEEVAFLYFPAARLGDYALIAAMIVVGRLRFSEDRCRLEGRPEFLRRWSIPLRDNKRWGDREWPRLAREVMNEIADTRKLSVIIERDLATAISRLPAQRI